MSRILVVCTTDSMIWNFLTPHIEELIKNGHYVECVCSKTGFFFDDLKNTKGIIINEIDFSRSPYSFKNLVAYYKLNKLIRSKKIDTIFCHEPVGGALGRLAGHKNKCKVIYMAHGFHFFQGAPKTRFIYKIVEKWLSRYTNTLITINEEDYQASLRFKAKRCIKINGIGVDTLKYSSNLDSKCLKEELGLSNHDKILLSVGELIPRKNQATIIKALALINDSSYHLLIAGEGPLLDKLQRLAKRMKIEKQVKFLGFRKDVRNFYNVADLFVLPSVHEGLSVALMEAMACGLPVVASKIRGNVDLIEEGAGGYLVDTFDANAYSDAIKKALCLRDTFGRNNKKRIELFDIKHVKKQIQSCFRTED